MANLARRNILIFHLGALGDFVVTWPIALALARLYPQSRVFYVTHGEKGALAERALRVESLDAESGGWHRLFSDSPDLPAPAAKVLAGSHTVVSFLSGPNDHWSQNIRSANPEANLINIKTTFPSTGPAHAEEFTGHQTEFLVDQLEPWPAIASGARQILRSIAERGIAVRPGTKGAVVIHPGGERRENAGRQIDTSNWHLNLAHAGTTVRVLLGEVELEKWPAIQIDRFRAVADVRTPRALVELYTEINSAAAFIGNDSGPGHLAAILGVPTVSLFGETSLPERWKPLGPCVRVIYAPLDSIGVNTVFGELGMVRAMSSNPVTPLVDADYD